MALLGNFPLRVLNIRTKSQAKNTNHGGGNIENYVSVEKQLLWIDIVRSNLSNHSDVIQPYISKKGINFEIIN